MSTPHCSLVIYLNKEDSLFEDFLRDLRSFFQKFPLSYELIVVLEKNVSTPIIEKNENIVIIQNKICLGKAESLRQGLNQAQGSCLLVTEPTLATPLGDLFKILQYLMTDENLSLCWGDRTLKKDSFFCQAQTPRHRTEKFFNGILIEKNGSSFKDPTCEIFGIKKDAWQKLNLQLPPLHGWYLGMQIQKQLAKTNLQTLTLAVHDSGATPRSCSIWKLRWDLLKQSLC